MVTTVKFSEFDVADINDSSTQNVGLTSGVNTREDKFYRWTTAGRPATPFNGLLGLNTTLQQYEFWDSVSNVWAQLADTNIFPILASHLAGEGASLIGLQNQSNVNDKFVQDLANASFIAQTDNGTLQNGQFLGSLTTGIVKSTTVTGVLSISAPLTSIDSLTTSAHQFLITTAADTYATFGPLTDGQLIIGSTGLAPVIATLTQGSGVTITNGPGSITISAAGSGGTVTSLSGGTGITLTPDPITTTGSIGLTIPVAVTSGGTGLISFALGDTIYASSANVLAALPGNITTAKQYLSQTGTGAVSAAPVWATISGSDITGAALTKTDDTNVTLTLGGTPATALLRAASLTLGWIGQLALTRGGTNASLTASNGGIVYSTATAMAILAGTATANQVLLSGSNTTPAWSTATYPATTTINQLLYSSSNNIIAGLATANSSVLVTSAGGVPSLSTTLPSGLTIPGFAASGANADITSMTGLTGYLQAPIGVKDTNGNILLSFGVAASAVNYLRISNAPTTSTGPALSALGSDSSIPLRIQPTNSYVALIDITSTIAPALRFYNASATHYTGLRVSNAQATDVTFILPAADGTSLAPIVTDGSANLSFLPGAWVSFTPGFTGFSADPTNVTAFYKKIGNTCFIQITMTAGTSNATAFTITGLPFTSVTGRNQRSGLFIATDNSISVYTCDLNIPTASTTITVRNLSSGTGWTALGTKGVNFSWFYETA